MSAARPRPAFGKVLHHQGEPYFYDVNSGEILHIDPVLAAVLPVFGSTEETAGLSRLGRLHGSAAVRKAISEIRTARSTEGLFLSERPEIAATAESCLHWDRYHGGLSHLTMTLTDRCNLRCRYCLHSSSCSWIRPHRNRSLSPASALQALRYFGDRCGDSPHPGVSLYGGEPLLEFGLIKELVATAGNHPQWPDLRFTIDTNATLITGKIAEFLVRQKIFLQVSLDGPATIHDRYRVTRGGQPTHRAVLRGVETVLKMDPEAAGRITFIATLAPPYDFLAVADYFDHFPLFAKLGIPGTPFATLNVANLDGIDLTGCEPEAGASGGGHGKQRRANWNRAREQYLQGRAGDGTTALSPTLARFFDAGLIRFHHRSRSRLPEPFPPTGFCRPGQRRLHVRTDGSFQPCERVGESLVIGDTARGIDREKVEMIFSALFGAVRSRCRDCWSLRLCGICFTALAPKWSPGDPVAAEIPPESCQAVRANTEETIRLFLDLRNRDPRALDFLAGSKMI